MNNRTLHDDPHRDLSDLQTSPDWFDWAKDEPLPPVWRRWKNEREDNPEWFKPKDDQDEPTGHAETIIELIKRLNALESRVMLLESLNKDIFFERLNEKTWQQRIINTPDSNDITGQTVVSF